MEHYLKKGGEGEKEEERKLKLQGIVHHESQGVYLGQGWHQEGCLTAFSVHKSQDRRR